MIFHIFQNFSHFFRIFPPGLSPSKQSVLARGEQNRRKDNKKNRTNRCCTLVVARLSSSYQGASGRRTVSPRNFCDAESLAKRYSETCHQACKRRDWRVPNPPGANPLIAERAPWRSSQSRATGGRQPVGNPYRFLCHFFCTPGDPCATPIVTRGGGPFSYQGVSTRGVRHPSA